MSQTNYNHLHRYEAVTAEKRSFRCLIAGCRHVITKSLIVGRICECYSCGESMEVTDDRVKNKHIAHKDCHPNSPKPKHGKLSIADLVNEMKNKPKASESGTTTP